MTTETTTAVAAPATKPAKAPKAKKPAKKAAAKKATKKTAAKKTERAKKEGLRKPQERILKTLAKATKPLSRAQIAEKAQVDQAFCTSYIGSSNEDTRKANDDKLFPSLITLGLVRVEQHEGEPAVYSATAKGKAEAAKL